MAPSLPQPPAETRTIEQWAHDYIVATRLDVKCQPGAPPTLAEPASARVPTRPGRPPELVTTTNKPRSFKQGALAQPRARAELNHKFWHHELQAAELFLWAFLRFREAEPDFLAGLLRLFGDEVRHMALYQACIEAEGFALGSFPVRDWFWDRLPTCQTKLQFVALMGMGLEAANLEHTLRFAQWFRAVGDEMSARVQDQVGQEEVAHVRFANHWFAQWTGGVDFETWKASLPPPLSPLLMRGKTLATRRRLDARFPQDFVDALTAWQPDDLVSHEVLR